MEEWYYRSAVGGHEQGPFTLGDIRALARRDMVVASDFVRRGLHENRVRLADLPTSGGEAFGNISRFGKPLFAAICECGASLPFGGVSTLRCFENGFEVVRTRRVRHAVPFEAVEAIRFRRVRQTFYRRNVQLGWMLAFKWRTAGKSRVASTGLSTPTEGREPAIVGGMREVAGMVSVRIAERVVRQLDRDALEASGLPLRISRNGIRLGSGFPWLRREIVGWGDLDPPSLVGGVLTIRSRAGLLANVETGSENFFPMLQVIASYCPAFAALEP
jgi:hypothetical protein